MVFQIIAILIGKGWYLTVVLIFIPLVFGVVLMCFHVFFGYLSSFEGYTQICAQFYIRIFPFYCEIPWDLAICLFCIRQTYWGHYGNVEDSGELGFSVAWVNTCSSALPKATNPYLCYCLCTVISSITLHFQTYWRTNYLATLPRTQLTPFGMLFGLNITQL